MSFVCRVICTRSKLQKGTEGGGGHKIVDMFQDVCCIFVAYFELLRLVPCSTVFVTKQLCLDRHLSLEP